jgi:molecular chaperone HscB
MTKVPTQPGVPLVCWSCSAIAEGTLFCPACRRIQPLPPGADYFQVFEMPRRLRLDPRELEERFHRLSWKLHPDNFVRASERERALSLDRAAQLNDAFRTLADPVSRVEYLLGLEGMRKEGQTKQQAPPELLEEVFELNESLDELRAARQSNGNPLEMAALRERLAAEEKKFTAKLGEVDAELEATAGEWDAALDSAADAGRRKELLARMNDILNRRSYIRNLVVGVQKEMAEA